MNDEKEIAEDSENSRQAPEEDLPAGIARLHEEWLRDGLISPEPEPPKVELEPVIFPEPVGDYRVPAEDARVRLALSEEAMRRLLESGELDSILVNFDDGVRRMVSESALVRFLEDAGMDAALAEKLAGPSAEVESAIESLREQIREIGDLHARQLQQFKDVLLLELRNLKEQDRDLASFIYDLTDALEELFPKLRKRKRTAF